MLELLISVTILSIIVGIVYSSLVSVTDTAAAARDSNETLRFRQFLWRSFSENLAAVYSDPACEVAGYQLVGENESGPYGPADSLRFCTSLPLSGPGSLPGVMRVVSYRVEEASAEDAGADTGGNFAIDKTEAAQDQGLYLFVSEMPLVLEDQDFDPEMSDISQSGMEYQVPIASMDIMYYDAETEEWVEDWDSMAQARLPWAVHIMINFARSEEDVAADYQAGVNPEDSADLDMMIALPMGAGVVEPFLDLNHQRESSDSTEDLEGNTKHKKERTKDKKKPDGNSGAT